MIEITDQIALDEDELQWQFVRASGPGGQNVNKVATAVQLRFDAAGSSALPPAVRERLMRLAGRRLGGDGTLIIEAKRYRSQARNRQDAIERLIELIRRAAQPPKPRKKTKPTAAAKARRLASKHRRGDVKRLRTAPGEEGP